MDEIVSCGLHLPFQVSEDSNSVWPYRENGEPTRISSTDFTYNCVGRNVNSLDLLHPDQIRDDERRREDHISFGNAGRTRGDDNDDGTEMETPRSNCKHDVGILTKGGEDSEVYVRRFAQLRESTNTGEASQNRLSNKVENKRDDDTAMGLKHCPNYGTIKTLQASFGQLFRISTIGSITWSKVPDGVCRLVLPHPDPASQTGGTFDGQGNVSIMSTCDENDVSKQGCNSSLMVVETFANKQERLRFALAYGYDLPFDSRDPKEFIKYTDYLECVEEFGFNHIIIIGEVDYGMVFLDCYGRLFHWDDMCERLWLSGSDDGLPWIVDDDRIVYKHKILM